jgi:hypothetical protein
VGTARPLPLLLAATALAAFGCAKAKGDSAAPAAAAAPSGSELLPSGAIVFPREGGRPDPDAGKSRRRVGEDDSFFREKFDLAQASAEAGDDESALQVVAAALALEPPGPWESKFKGLKQTIKARHMQLDVVRADASGAKDYVVFDEDVDFVVRIRNLGAHDLIVRPPAGPGPSEVSGSVLALSIERRDRDIYSAALVRSWTQSVPLVPPGETELVVPPESVREVTVRVPADDVGGAIAGLRVLQVSGDLRLTGASMGIAEPVMRIPIRAGRVVVLPRNYEPIAADPLGSLRKALSVTAPVHVLIATEMLLPSDRPAAVGLLADALAAGDPALAPAIGAALALLRDKAGDAAAAGMAEPLVRRMRTHPARVPDLADGLVALTGVSIAPDVRLWEDWWRRGRR